MEATSGLRARGALGVVLIVLVALLAIPAAVVLLLPHHPPKLTADNLARSVREDSGWSAAGCAHKQGAHWGCSVSNPVSSDDSAVYDVLMTSGHCWKARVVSRHNGELKHRT